jgi:ubiquinone/menaquinone biosynthesis C-methylase UbiE
LQQQGFSEGRVLEVGCGSGEVATSSPLNFLKPFEEKSFDAVVSLNTFHVVKDPILIVNEIERVLATDGCLMVELHSDYHALVIVKPLF